jgi:P27 family predicted phage terminase small subunit
MPGPAPTPTAVKALKGNPGRRPLNTAEPVTPQLSITPPDWMEGDELAKQFWHEIGNVVRAMNVAQESDRVALELLALCLSEVRRARDELDREGRVSSSMQGGEQPSAQFKIMKQMIAQAVAIMKEFGMTPAARSRVKTLAAGQKKSKLSAFLGGQEE